MARRIADLQQQLEELAAQQIVIRGVNDQGGALDGAVGGGLDDAASRNDDPIPADGAPVSSNGGAASNNGGAALSNDGATSNNGGAMNGVIHRELRDANDGNNHRRSQEETRRRNSEHFDIFRVPGLDQRNPLNMRLQD